MTSLFHKETITQSEKLNENTHRKMNVAPVANEMEDQACSALKMAQFCFLCQRPGHDLNRKQTKKYHHIAPLKLKVLATRYVTVIGPRGNGPGTLYLRIGYDFKRPNHNILCSLQENCKFISINKITNRGRESSTCEIVR